MNKSNRPAILFLSQRLPFPPDKGEKVSSFNIVKHLGQRFDLHIGTFADEAEDAAAAERLKAYCSSLYVKRIIKPWAWAPAVLRWLAGQPLSFALFRSTGLKAYVLDVVKQYHPVAIVAHSSNIADYALVSTNRLTVRIFHFVDVDSEKFFAYAAEARGWKRWGLKLEAKRVRAAEARLTAHADAVAFVSDEEAALFRSLVDADAAKIVTIANGVDADAFDPAKPWPKPAWEDGPVFVFTGTMNYRPNVDAVLWFANSVLPAVRAVHTTAQFAIVGNNPLPVIRALARRPGVLVTGQVPEIQPYLAHASIVVAPLRIARGVQNKVLEALAMGRPLIASPDALTGIGAPGAVPAMTAEGQEAWIAACLKLLENPTEAEAMARRARPFVLARFSWTERLRTLDALLPLARDPSPASAQTE